MLGTLVVVRSTARPPAYRPLLSQHGRVTRLRSTLGRTSNILVARCVRCPRLDLRVLCALYPLQVLSAVLESASTGVAAAVARALTVRPPPSNAPSQMDTSVATDGAA